MRWFQFKFPLCVYLIGSLVQMLWDRSQQPCHAGYTSSHWNTQVKQHWTSMVLVRKTGWEVMVLFWYQCCQKKSGLYQSCPLPQVLVQVSVIGWASPITTANNIGDKTKTDTVLIMTTWPLSLAINKTCHLHFNKLQQTSKQAVVTFMSRQVVMSFFLHIKTFLWSQKILLR